MLGEGLDTISNKRRRTPTHDPARCSSEEPRFGTRDVERKWEMETTRVREKEVGRCGTRKRE